MSGHDVAVVGAGSAGLLLGCLLAQRGLDVVVLERRSEPQGGSRAIGIHPPGLRALDRAGVGAHVRDQAVAIRAGVAMSRGRELGTVRFDGSPIRSLPQHRTEALLRQRLEALAPDALRAGAGVTGIEPGDGAVGLGLADGGAVEARWVVAADGVRGQLRGMLGIGTAALPGEAHYAMADGPDRTGLPHAAALHIEPGGIVESFPLVHGDRRWVARLDGPGDGMAAAGLRAVVAERIGAEPPIVDEAPVSAFVARQRLADAFSRGRVALLGDAAHELSPIGGQGMSLGWLDAAALEEALVRAIATADEAPVESWARTRRAAARRAMRRAAWNMRMGAPCSPARLAARTALVRALATPPASTMLAASFTMRGL
ncbi:FAD-dependent monooxygenase [Agrococcus terreus]|uniref:FAD-dependent oxidoreductase n=1 Tax=Agrococcus terreus TaxID=574649 RepID=UPI00384A4DDE